MRSARAEPAAKPAEGSGHAADVTISTGILPTLLGYHLRRAQSAVFRHFAEVVGAEEDITPGLFGMAQVIAANPGLCQSRLAEAMGVDRSTIAALRRMERLVLRHEAEIARDLSAEERRTLVDLLARLGARLPGLAPPAGAGRHVRDRRSASVQPPARAARRAEGP